MGCRRFLSMIENRPLKRIKNQLLTRLPWQVGARSGNQQRDVGRSGRLCRRALRHLRHKRLLRGCQPAWSVNLPGLSTCLAC